MGERFLVFPFGILITARYAQTIESGNGLISVRPRPEPFNRRVGAFSL